MEEIKQILNNFSEQQGWTIETQYDLLIRYIDQLPNRKQSTDFENFLFDVVEEENGILEQ